MVRFNVQFEVRMQRKVAQETDDSHGVVIVLVPSRFFRLRFDEQLPAEIDLLLVVYVRR